MTNPLLASWETPFQMPPFAEIEDAHIAPALDAGFVDGRAAIAAIADNPEPPTFERSKSGA